MTDYLIRDARHPDFNPDDPRHAVPPTTEQRIARIERDLESIKETLEFIKSTMVNADTTITKVAAEVMPTINGLMESPMIKMLGGKKR